jgi:hypothetical protein
MELKRARSGKTVEGDAGSLALAALGAGVGVW